MPLTHLHLELLSEHSPEYARYSREVGGDFHLVELYKIHYAGVDSQQQEGSSIGWSDPEYFHGTGHCGCVNTPRAAPRSIDTGTFLIPVEDWCKSKVCATGSILKQGHRLKYVQCTERGHFFSRIVGDAMCFAQNKQQMMTSNGVPHQQTYSLFLCKARNVRQGKGGLSYKYVASDEDIIPCYLAAVCCL